MSNNEYKELFFKDSVEKKLNIVFDGGIITNTELHSNQFELTESICSEESLRFGGCEASVLKFKVSNIYSSLVGKELDVSMFINGDTENPYRFGKFKVYSDTPTADRSFKDIVAYDKMYEIINSDVAEWYNSLTFPMTLKEFRSSFVSHYGIEEVDVVLVNDDMMVEKTIETVELSGRDVARAICEINGCFGHINRNNEFEYVVLPEISYIYPQNILYPSNALYPLNILDDSPTISRRHYISCQYEDFKTHRIDGVDVYEDGESIGNVINDGNNIYIIQDNFLIYGKSTTELTTILTSLLGLISVAEYRPARIIALGNPAISLGEVIRLTTRHQAINTYVLNRTISGIQALRDNFNTSGVEYYEKDVNSVKNEIIKLKSKTNKLTRSVEETVSKIEDVEKNLSTEIRQTSEGLTVKIENLDTKAANAISKADEAKLAADEATSKAELAQSDLEEAEKNLADVTSRVGVTEAEVEAAQAAVAQAKEVADEADAAASAAQSTADIAKAKAEASQAAADNAQKSADDSAKYATNYLELSSSGLIVGNLIDDELGKNVLIGNDAVSIRDGDTILADYTADKIRLGINSDSSIIELCANSASMGIVEEVNNKKYFNIKSNNDGLRLENDNVIDLNSSYVENGLRLSSRAVFNTRDSNPYIIFRSSQYSDDGLFSGVATSTYYGLGKILIETKNSNGDGVEIDINENPGHLSLNGNLDIEYSKFIFIKTSDGTELGVMGMANNNELTIGWDGYDARIGATSVYGNKVNVVGDNVALQGTVTVNGTDLDLDSRPKVGSLYASTLAYFVWGVYQASSTFSYSGRVKDEGGWGPKGFACWYQFYAMMQNAPDGNYSVDVFTILQYGDETYIGCIKGTSSFSVTWQKLAKVRADSAWDNTVNQQLLIAASDEKAYGAFLGVAESNWTFCPQTDKYLRLGSPNYRWGIIYSASSTVSTSDRNLKKNIETLTEKHVKFFTMLQPVSFQFIDGTSGRTHIGFISQDVEEAMNACGLTDLDFAGFCKDQKTERVEKIIEVEKEVPTEIIDEETGEMRIVMETVIEEQTIEEDVPIEGEYIYSLRYEEFIALNTCVIQKHQSEIEMLKDEIEIIKKNIGL